MFGGTAVTTERKHALYFVGFVLSLAVLIMNTYLVGYARGYHECVENGTKEKAP